MRPYNGYAANTTVQVMDDDIALFRGFQYDACDYVALCRTKAVSQAPFKQLKKVDNQTLLQELRVKRSNGYVFQTRE